LSFLLGNMLAVQAKASAGSVGGRLRSAVS